MVLSKKQSPSISYSSILEEVKLSVWDFFFFTSYSKWQSRTSCEPVSEKRFSWINHYFYLPVYDFFETGSSYVTQVDTKLGAFISTSQVLGSYMVNDATMFSWLHHFYYLALNDGLLDFLFSCLFELLVLTCRMSSSCLYGSTLPPSLFCGPWQMTGFCFIGLGQWETQQGFGDKQMVGNELHISLTSFFSLMVLLCSTGWPIADLPASASLTIGKPCIFHLSDRFFLECYDAFLLHPVSFSGL